MVKKEDKDRIMVLLVIGLFLATWVFVNSQQYVQGAVSYALIGAISLFLYNRWGTFGRVSDIEGIDSNWVKDGLIGLGLGVGTIFLGQFVSFIGVIGIPQVSSVAGTVGRFIIIVPLASIFEEVFFRDFFHDLWESKIGVPRLFATLITAVGFSVFHLSAYGESLSSAGGSFFSAGLMGFIFGIVTEKQNSLIGSIFYHATLNFYLSFFVLKVVVG